MPSKKGKQVKPTDKPTGQKRTQSPEVALPPSHEDPEVTVTDSRSEIPQAAFFCQKEHGQLIINIPAVNWASFCFQYK